ncbi:unnamed protein product [Ambrosiozyma monospora]|uniref:Unnamed protein product n=1 Tax=Ambrosiozyma monospora TaxID=43982 RepID=A0ACB5SU90_AMBMO|nr:unnamed protein product [Ambrosiozyma monospora]
MQQSSDTVDTYKTAPSKTHSNRTSVGSDIMLAQAQARANNRYSYDSSMTQPSSSNLLNTYNNNTDRSTIHTHSNSENQSFNQHHSSSNSYSHQQSSSSHDFPVAVLPKYDNYTSDDDSPETPANMSTVGKADLDRLAQQQEHEEQQIEESPKRVPNKGLDKLKKKIFPVANPVEDVNESELSDSQMRLGKAKRSGTRPNSMLPPVPPDLEIQKKHRHQHHRQSSKNQRILEEETIKSPSTINGDHLLDEDQLVQQQKNRRLPRRPPQSLPPSSLKSPTTNGEPKSAKHQHFKDDDELIDPIYQDNEIPSGANTPTQQKKQSKMFEFPFLSSSKGSRPDSGTLPTADGEPHALLGSEASNSDHRLQKKLLTKFRRMKTFGGNKHLSLESSNRNYEDELDLKNRQKTEFFMQSMVCGFPSALLISTHFIKDETGSKRIPMLLPLLSCSLTDTSKDAHTKRRKYKVNLEYGLGNNVLRWSLIRTSKDFSDLHNRIRLQLLQDNVLAKNPLKERDTTKKDTSGRKEKELPKFPKFKHSIPARIIHRASTTKRDSGIYEPTLMSPTSYTAPNNDATPLPTVSQQNGSEILPYSGNADNHSIASVGSNSTAESQSSLWRRHGIFKRTKTKLGSAVGGGGGPGGDAEEQRHADAYRNALQNYLDLLLRKMMLSAQANRIFQFFELSPVSVLLANENSKKRKEGYLLVRNRAKAQGWRVGHLKPSEMKAMINRHTLKWFIVGHSYIMYVENINSTTPLDIFFIDSKFRFKLSGLTEKQQQEDYEDGDEDEDDDDEDDDEGGTASQMIDTMDPTETMVFCHS